MRAEYRDLRLFGKRLQCSANPDQIVIAGARAMKACASGSSASLASVAHGPARITGAPHQHVVGFSQASGGSSLGTRRISISAGATTLVTADATATPPRPPTATAAAATGCAGAAEVAAVLTAEVAAFKAASDAR